MAKFLRKKEEAARRESPGMSGAGDPALRERIAGKAYELFQERGGTHGHDLDDWLEAERLVLAERGSPAARSKAPASQSPEPGRRSAWRTGGPGI